MGLISWYLISRNEKKKSIFWSEQITALIYYSLHILGYQNSNIWYDMYQEIDIFYIRNISWYKFFFGIKKSNSWYKKRILVIKKINLIFLYNNQSHFFISRIEGGGGGGLYKK